MNKIIIILILLITCYLFYSTEKFSQEVDISYSIVNTKNNITYNIVSLIQLKFGIQKMIINNIKSNKIIDVLFLDYILYNIDKESKYATANNPLFAYQVKTITDIDSVLYFNNDIISYTVKTTNVTNVYNKTNYSLGLYGEQLLLYEKNSTFNKNKNIDIKPTSFNDIKNVTLNKINNTDFYEIFITDNSDYVIVKN